MPGCSGESPGSHGPAPAAHTTSPGAGKGRELSTGRMGFFCCKSQQVVLLHELRGLFIPPLHLHECLLARSYRLPCGGSCKLFSGFSLPTMAPLAPSCLSRSRELELHSTQADVGSTVHDPAPAHGLLEGPRRPGSNRSGGHKVPWKLPSSGGFLTHFCVWDVRPWPVHSLHPAWELLKRARVKIILIACGGHICSDTGGGSVLRQRSLSQPLSPALPLHCPSQPRREIQALLQPVGQRWGLRTTRGMSPGLSQASSLLQGCLLLEQVEGEILSIPSSVWTRGPDPTRVL